MLHAMATAPLLGKCKGRGLRVSWKWSAMHVRSPFILNHPPKVMALQKSKRGCVNVGAVWGQMPSGGGQRALNEVMSTINVPGMSKKKNVSKDRKPDWSGMGKNLAEEIIKAGKEEKS